MTERVEAGGLKVATSLYDLVKDEIAPGTGIDPAGLWTAFAAILADLAPRNRDLLARRDALQARIDDWYRGRRGQPIDQGAYRAFLSDIGYLVPEGPDFAVTTTNLDPEITSVAGPQLVVPVSNARNRFFWLAPSLHRTMNMPMMESTMPMPATTMGAVM